jgi:hypothetical protein
VRRKKNLGKKEDVKMATRTTWVSKPPVIFSGESSFHAVSPHRPSWTRYGLLCGHGLPVLGCGFRSQMAPTDRRPSLGRLNVLVAFPQVRWEAHSLFLCMFTQTSSTEVVHRAARRRRKMAEAALKFVNIWNINTHVLCAWCLGERESVRVHYDDRVIPQCQSFGAIRYLWLLSG